MRPHGPFATDLFMPWNDIELFISKPKDFGIDNNELLGQIENLLQVS